MKATLMFGAGDVRVLDVPDATLIEPTDAVVRVVRACICGSDLHPFHSKPAGEVGQAMGHEAIGVVEETGTEVSRIAKGDFVIVPFGLEDNTCVYCREGVHTSCVHGSFLSGAQAEAVRVSQADGSLVKVPGVGEDAKRRRPARRPPTHQGHRGGPRPASRAVHRRRAHRLRGCR